VSTTGFVALSTFTGENGERFEDCSTLSRTQAGQIMVQITCNDAGTAAGVSFQHANGNIIEVDVGLCESTGSELQRGGALCDLEDYGGTGLGADCPAGATNCDKIRHMNFCVECKSQRQTPFGFGRI